ncbi:MAG: hypothetical protein INQ03_25220 [Candidatus Heimdallarchaeota archaeon]|nr:hypothetical protein [Candidatus Heimdallarchaeota archaeon]
MNRRFYIYISLILLLQVSFVFLRNQPYYISRSGEIYSRFGGPFSYDGRGILDTYAIRDMEMRNTAYASLYHDMESRNTSIYFTISMEPVEMELLYETTEHMGFDFELDPSYYVFYGNFSSFSVKIDGINQNIPSYRNGCVINIGFENPDTGIHTNHYYNFIRYDFLYEYVTEEYLYHQFDLSVAFSFDVYSNHSRYSSDGSPVHLGTTPVSEMQLLLGSPNLTISKDLPIVIYIALLALFMFIINKEHLGRPKIENTSDLRFHTYILPHISVLSLAVFAINGAREPIEGVITYFIIFSVYSIVPILIEYTNRTYHYRGIFLHNKLRSNNYIVSNETQKPLLPNTIVWEPSLYSDDPLQVLNNIDMVYFDTIRRWFVISVILIAVLVLIDLSLYLWIVYLIWVLIRKIKFKI